MEQPVQLRKVLEEGQVTDPGSVSSRNIAMGTVIDRQRDFIALLQQHDQQRINSSNKG